MQERIDSEKARVRINLLLSAEGHRMLKTQAANASQTMGLYIETLLREKNDESKRSRTA